MRRYFGMTILALSLLVTLMLDAQPVQAMRINTLNSSRARTAVSQLDGKIQESVAGETTPQDPAGNDPYTSVYLGNTVYGEYTTVYISGASITVRPRFEPGEIRVTSSSSAYNYSVGVYADIMGFSSTTYTNKQIGASIANQTYYVDANHSVHVKYRVQVYAGSTSNAGYSDYYDLILQ